MEEPTLHLLANHKPNGNESSLAVAWDREHFFQ